MLLDDDLLIIREQMYQEFLINSFDILPLSLAAALNPAKGKGWDQNF